MWSELSRPEGPSGSLFVYTLPEVGWGWLVSAFGGMQDRQVFVDDFRQAGEFVVICGYQGHTVWLLMPWAGLYGLCAGYEGCPLDLVVD